MFGIAEYSAVECGRGEDVCPFYLANLIAYNTTDTWEVRVATVNGPLYKEISDVQVDLLQSTLGVQNMGLGVVAFAPGALRMRVQFTVSSCGMCDDFGDGVHASIIENDDYVFAAYDDGELTITQSFEVQSNSWATLSVTVVPDEHPPVAAHDLNSIEWANHPMGLGLVVDESRSLSDDPDDDIVFEFWWVDGDPIPHGGVVPHGSHAVAIEAHDARGAVHRSTAKWVYVGDATFAP